MITRGFPYGLGQFKKITLFPQKKETEERKTPEEAYIIFYILPRRNKKRIFKNSL